MTSLRNALLAVLLAAFAAPGCKVTSVGVAPVAAPAAAAAPASPRALAEAPKRILIVFDEDPDNFPGLGTLDRSVRASFEALFPKAVEIHSEFVGLSRVGRPGYAAEAAAFLRSKYAASPPDLIVAALEPSLNFLLGYGEAMFPGVPVIFCGVDAATVQARSLPANFTGVLLERSFSPTLEIALRLQPRLRQVFVVVGAAPFDRYLEALVRRDLKPLEGRVAINYLVGLGMDHYRKRLSALPAESAILYVTVFEDGTGRHFIPHDVAASISAAANAPVYVFLDQFVGRGVVGGNVYGTDALGALVADMGRKIFEGATPVSLPITVAADQVDLFDARQLARWRLDEDLLPPGAIVRYREPTAWQVYRWYFITALGLVLLQAALIGGLLLARRRQRRAEEEARRQRDDLAHVLRVTTLGELTSTLAHEVSQPIGAILLNAESAIRYLEGMASEDEDLAETLADIMRSAEHASLVIDRLRAHFRKERSQYGPIDVKVMVQDVVRLLRTAMLTERIDIQLLFGQRVGPVQGDKVQLEQVLLNVLRNAVDAIGASGDGPRVITIRTRESRLGYVVIEVSDSGIGVKDIEVEHIFQHFFSTKPQGLGMGLAISRSIIEAHGGRIWASANPDRGLTVHIELEGAIEGRGRARAAATERAP